MANRIQKGYRSHMEQNSPDMDKMWEKIQQHIDSQPQKPVQTVQENQPEPEMKRRRIGFVKYAAAAACLVAVVIVRSVVSEIVVMRIIDRRRYVSFVVVTYVTKMLD